MFRQEKLRLEPTLFSGAESVDPKTVDQGNESPMAESCAEKTFFIFDKEVGSFCLPKIRSINNNNCSSVAYGYLIYAATLTIELARSSL